MRVLTQPLGHVGHETFEAVLAAAGPYARLAVAGQIRPDRLAILAQVPGDRGDRPAPSMQRVRVDVFLPCEHGGRAPSSWWWSETISIEGAPPPSGGAQRVGNFSEQLWGDSPERHHGSPSRSSPLSTASGVVPTGMKHSARYFPGARSATLC